MPQRPSSQLSLLDWTPPEATVRFDDRMVRAASIRAQVCRAIAVALGDCHVPREEIAARMSAFLGERISKHMLDAYASQAREEHAISLPRFLALLHVTQDRRLLELIAEMFGWAVIERRHLPLIELAAVQDRVDELRRTADALKRQAKSRGAL